MHSLSGCLVKYIICHIYFCQTAHHQNVKEYTYAIFQRNTYTTDYIYSLPGGQRAELIDGVIYDMAPPKQIASETCYEFIRRNP